MEYLNKPAPALPMNAEMFDIAGESIVNLFGQT